MIDVTVFKNSFGNIFAFEIVNHGEDIVCAAVSALSLNTVNAIESFTDTSFKVELEEEGGYLYFEIEDNINISDSAILLLKSLLLGLEGIEAQYEKSISISIEEVG